MRDGFRFGRERVNGVRAGTFGTNEVIMRDFRSRPNVISGSTSSTRIPVDQSRALSRRQSLDEQQRSFQDSSSPSSFHRHRPPA